MKKLMTILLVFAMLLGLCACGSSAGEDAPKDGLQVGYAREHFTPTIPTPLGGAGNAETRLSSGFVDYIYATCVAFKDGDQTAMIFTIDLLAVTATMTQKVRDALEKETGVPGENIMLVATHTHSAPDPWAQNAGAEEFHRAFQKACLKAGKDAIADLTPATLSAAKTDIDYTYPRHYLMEDGTYAADSYSALAQPIKDYATKKDSGATILKIDREGDKKDIVMLNWQTHTTRHSANTEISADLVGGARDAFEKETGMLFAYYLGAAGNLNPSSKIAGDAPEGDHKVFGKLISDAVIAALPNVQPVEGSGIKVTKHTMEYAVCHDDEHLVTEARRIIDLWNQRGQDATAVSADCKAVGISTIHHAKAIVARPSRPTTDTFDIYAMSIADIGFIYAPYEMFAQQGIYIKENSPFEYTFVCTVANDYRNYFPSQEAFDYFGCYEATTSYFARGVAEATAEQFVTMLKGLK